jgi:hypothetical protein
LAVVGKKGIVLVTTDKPVSSGTSVR